MSRKGKKLSPVTIVVALILIAGIVLSSDLVRTILTIIGAVSLIMFVEKKLDEKK